MKNPKINNYKFKKLKTLCYLQDKNSNILKKNSKYQTIK